MVPFGVIIPNSSVAGLYLTTSPLGRNRSKTPELGRIGAEGVIRRSRPQGPRKNNFAYATPAISTHRTFRRRRPDRRKQSRARRDETRSTANREHGRPSGA